MASPPSPPPGLSHSARPPSASSNRPGGRSRSRRLINAESVLVFSRYEPEPPSTSTASSPSSSAYSPQVYTSAPSSSASTTFHLPSRNRPNPTPPRRRESFIEANGRFALNPLDPLCTDHLRWESVDIVFVDRESVSECPICLHPYTCPKVTPCGHIFDHVCLLQHVAHCCSNNNVPVVIDDPMATVKCPLCASHFALGSLKNVDFRNVKSLLPGNSYEMTLVAITPTDVVLPYLGSPQVQTDIPTDVADISNLFSRFCFASRNYLSDIHTRMAGDLRQTLAEDPSLKPFVDVASKQVKITKNNLRMRKFPDNNSSTALALSDKCIPVDDARIFYQASDARQVFLHPLNHRCIAHEYNGDLRGASKKIKGAILEVERHTMNDTLRKRYRFLRHLPNGCEFALVELNINEELSKETVAHFKKELETRKNARKKKQVISKKEDEGVTENLDKALKDYFNLDRIASRNIQTAPVHDDEATFPSLCGTSPRDISSIQVVHNNNNAAHNTGDTAHNSNFSPPDNNNTGAGNWRPAGTASPFVPATSTTTSIPVGPVGEAAGWGAAVSSYSSVASNMGLFPALGSSPTGADTSNMMAHSPPRGAWANNTLHGNSNNNNSAAVAGGPGVPNHPRRRPRYRTLQSNAGTNHRR